MFVAECEFCVEPVGVCDIGAKGAGEGFPDVPEAVDVSVVGEEGTIGCGEAVGDHLGGVDLEVD